MTRQQEIELLDETIRRFGPHSYLGPWLAEHRDEIVRDMEMDYEPRPLLPKAARQMALEIRAKAEEDATAIREAGRAWNSEREADQYANARLAEYRAERRA